MKNISLKYINIIINDENYITFVKIMKKNSTRKIFEKYERERIKKVKDDKKIYKISFFVCFNIL